MPKQSVKQKTMKSRAVSRLIEPGNNVTCASCSEPVKFLTREQAHQIIANVYVAGKWDRVEHFHELCYLEGGEPYGPAA